MSTPSFQGCSKFAAMLAQPRRGMYIAYALVGTAPILFALAIGAHASLPIAPSSPVVQPCGVDSVFRGYFATPQWMLYPLILPLAAYVVKWISDRLCATGGATDLPIVALLSDDAARARARQRFRNLALDGRIFVFSVLLSTVVFVADIQELAQIYLTNYSGPAVQTCPAELDWTVFFIRTGPGDPGYISKETNLVLVLLAYLNQYVVNILAWFAVAIIFAHNVTYLKMIYRRSAAHGRNADDFVALDFDDAQYDRCFGMLTLNRSFNAQLYFLVVGGAMMLVSRFDNVSAHQQKALAQLGHDVREMFATSSFSLQRLEGLSTSIFPDPGQVILPAAWTICFAIVCIPALLKFLPFFNSSIRQGGLASFLLEFLKPSHPLAMQPMLPSAMEELAWKFSRNSFWPTGDRRAHLLFYYTLFVFFLLIFPLKPSQVGVPIFALYIVSAFVVAVILTQLFFKSLRIGLSHFDDRLVEQKAPKSRSRTDSPIRLPERKEHERLASVPLPKMNIGAVFLSYASQDRAAVEKLGKALGDAGIDVWFDQRRLESGDDFDQMIKRNIRNCSLFVPIISAATQARREGYFRLEWNLAVDRSRLIAESVPFIVPVVIDPVAQTDALVPERFLQVQWTKAPGGEPPAEFVERMKRLVAAVGKPE